MIYTKRQVLDFELILTIEAILKLEQAAVPISWLASQLRDRGLRGFGNKAALTYFCERNGFGVEYIHKTGTQCVVKTLISPRYFGA